MDARKLQDLRNYGIHGAEAADEIDRLTRELAEAKANPVPSWTDTKFALDAWLKKKDISDHDPKSLFAVAAWRACWDFVRLSARPEFPSKESDHE